MDCLANNVVTPKGKREIAYTTTHLDTGTRVLNNLDGFNEINRVVVMLLESSCNCQNIRIKNDVVRVIDLEIEKNKELTDRKSVV